MHRITLLKKYSLIVHNLSVNEDKIKNGCDLVITGCRNFSSDAFSRIIPAVIGDNGINVKRIYIGGMSGIDGIGEWYGIKHGIPVCGFPVEYGLFDKSGRVDVLLLIWDGVSNRSKGIKENALRRGVVIFEVVCDVESVELIENPDCRVVDAIRKRLIVNNGYCPCTPHKDDDHICPCLKFRDYGECCCSLYVRAS